MAGDSDSDGTANGIEYSGLKSAAIRSAAGTATMDYHLNTTASGLTVSIQGSDDLQPGSWETLATRLRGTSTWRNAAGVILLGDTFQPSAQSSSRMLLQKTQFL